MVGSLAATFSLEPIAQDQTYHAFADRRALFGVSNFFDVASNIPFILVGIAGLRFCARSPVGPFRAAWITLFAGVALVSVGSAYYHWAPDDRTLVWDRLPMTIGFMGLFAAILGESLGEKIGKRLLIPLILVGLSSVLVWRWFDDLRFYVWVQFIPLLVIPIVLLLFRKQQSQPVFLAAALGFYLLAKVLEFYDREIFAATGGLVSGHSLKHVSASMACLALLLMLKGRERMKHEG